uniref:Uncharacterized protein n=1 Tax=Anguilla anguilla TaxID=7936 RepID=A0A0E9VRM3_ANGAN
MLGFNISAP